MLLICIVFVVILQQSFVHCQQRSIYTCCMLQSTLGTSGFCEQPISEFDLSVFPSHWTVPGIILNDITPQLVFELQPKPMLCQCGKNSKISITLGKSITKGDEWVPKNQQSKHSFITPEGRLFASGKEYGKEQYCLNKLTEIDSYGQSPDELDIELVMCSKSCYSKDTRVPSFESGPIETMESTIKSNWITKAEDCDTEDNSKKLQANSTDTTEKAECNWATFYFMNDNMYLIIDAEENFTTSIQDQTYPWARLPKSTFCKVGTDQDEVTFMKFCLTEIRKLFYDYQKLYAILAGVSAIFLLFNLTIYFALRDSLSISGYTEFLYSFCIYSYCVLSIVGLLIVPDSTDIRSICYAFSVLIQFFQLANGATLVALSFDILYTFCKFDKGNYTHDPEVSKLRIYIYFLFSLLFPLAIVCYGISKNHRPWDFKFEDHSGIPQYGLLHCTAPDWPMATYTQFTMQGLNLFLALISAYTILNKSKGHVDSYGGSLDPDRMDIFAKLFVYVFLFWILDFMQFFLSEELFTDKWYLIAFQVINYSQGIFAFFILVCNRRTMWGIRQKDWSLKNLFQHACCTCTSGRGNQEKDAEAEMPLSPLMKTTNFRRTTVRTNAFY